MKRKVYIYRSKVFTVFLPFVSVWNVMWIFSCSLLWKSQFWLPSLFLCAPRHGYYGTSGPPAPAKALTDLKLHLTNSSHPISSSSSTDMVVIHPGAVLAMVDLLPSVSSDSQPEVRKWKAMCFLSKWVKGFDGRQEVPFFSWVFHVRRQPDSVSQLHMCVLGESQSYWMITCR